MEVKIHTKRKINFMAGLLFVGIFCLNSGAFGYLPSDDACPLSEVVFIDPSVRDAETIVAQLPQGAEVVRLSPAMDGVAQISAHLAEKMNLSAIRIISHGNAGHFVLNGNRIDRDFLRDYGERISAWRYALAENGDILLYACNLVATDEGKAFVEHFVDLTGADIAASTDRTGGTENWDLEYQDGAIETSAIAVHEYQHHLATYTVTAIADNGTGAAGTLSKAINDANGNAGADTIEFNLTSGSTVTISAALPQITDSVTIDGNDSGTNVTVQVTTPGTSTFRVFDIDASGKTINISNMTIKGGAIHEANENGGGINIVAGSLNLESVTITGSKADQGGGIYCFRSTVTINYSTISSNIGDADYGGGIHSSETTLTINNSTINNNHHDGTRGGGIYIYALGVTATITNSTISNNTCDGEGGGLYVIYGTITLENCTISENHSDYDGSSDQGGGLYLWGSSTILNVRNTIIANNYRGSGTGTGDDYYGSNADTFNDNGYNIVKYQAGSASLQFTAITDIFYNTKADGTTGYSTWNQNNADLANQNLNLASTLADNGGPTQTLALSSGSFADGAIPYSAGTNTFNGSPGLDQRGYYRAFTGSRDIGAYELGGATPANNDYISTTTGNWSAVGTWDTYNSTTGTWGDPATKPTSSNNVVVATSDTVTVDGTDTVNAQTVSQGGILTVGANSLTASGAADINGTLSISTGTFDANGTFDATGGSVTFTDAGNLKLASTVTSLGTLTAGTATVTYDGTSGQTISGTNTFYNLTINNTHASEKVDASGSTSLAVTNNLSITDGIFKSKSDYANVSIGANGTLELSGDITVSGNWTNSGAFTPGTYKVTLDGTGQALSGATSFYNLTKNVTSADTLTFSTGSANKTTITNTLNLSGASGQLLSLRSSSAGTQWEIDPQGTRTISYVDVKDSNNVNATAIDPGDGSVDSGNNINWSFATKIDLTGPATATAGAVSTAFTLTSQDADGNASNVSADTTFDLSSNSSGTKVFYSNAAGTSVITQVTITSGTSTATFYYKDSATGTPTLTAAWNSGGTDLGSDTLQITVSLATTTLATTTATSYDCSVVKVEMHDGTSWVTIFSGTTALDVVPGGTFPEVSDLSLPAGTYSQIRVTFTNSFPVKGSRSHGGATYYTTAATFGGQTNLASTPTIVAGGIAEFTFRIEA